MKKVRFLVLLMAVFVLTIGIGTANAAWNAGASLKILVTADSAQLKPAKSGTANPVYATVAGEIFAANDTITITLTGGAKFSTAVPTLKSSVVDLGAGLTVAAVPLSGGTEGSTSATWRVVDPTGAGVADTLTLNTFAVAELDLTGVAAGGNVDLQMTMATVAGLPIGTTRSFFTDRTFYLFTAGASETVTLTPQTDIAIVSAVTGPFTAFTGDVFTSTATTIAFKNDSAAVLTEVPGALAMAAKKILITITGDFAGVTSLLDSTATGLFTGCDATGDQTSGTVDTFLFAAGDQVAYASNTGALAGGATATIAPQFTIDGVTQQAARGFKAKIDVLAEAGNWAAHVAKAATDHYEITRDGQTRYAYNIPNSTNVDGGYVRIINTSSQAGKIYGTMTDESGAVLGTANTVLVTSLAAGATKVLSSADLVALFADWTGRARLTIDGEVPSMEAYCLIRAANGTLTNLSPVAP